MKTIKKLVAIMVLSLIGVVIFLLGAYAFGWFTEFLCENATRYCIGMGIMLVVIVKLVMKEIDL